MEPLDYKHINIEVIFLKWFRMSLKRAGPCC
jgi:hypothetical protein